MAKKNRSSKPNHQNKQAYQTSAQTKKARIDQLKKEYSQRVNSISEQDLQYGIEQIDILFSEANRRIELIKSQSLTSYAINRLEEESGRDYFDTDVITDKKSLMNELYRVRVFLADKGSTIEGAKLETAQINAEIYKGKFGNQYNTEEHQYKRYDTGIIDTEIAQRAFKAYRKVEENWGTKITGEGAYGSENLIIAIYDAEVRGLDGEVYGDALLKAFYEEEEEMWNRATSERDNISAISGVIYDNIRERLGFN